MIRSWQGVVWILVAAMAIAVAVGVVGAKRAESAPEDGTVDPPPAGAGALPHAVAVALPPAGAGVRLSEILAGPARDWDGDGVFDARGDEWLEIQNVGTAVVALEEFRVADADTTIRYTLSGTLSPGELLLHSLAQLG